MPDSTESPGPAGAGVSPEAVAVAAAPVHDIGDKSKPRPGIALCLSGGGYRAMVFHLGVLWRLNDTGLLKAVQRVSSVSGGSITAGLLGLRWRQLGFDKADIAPGFEAEVVGP